MKFSDFGSVVARQFEAMSKHPLFRVQMDKEWLWETYLKSFPVGTNPMFRKRTEHDCQTCRSFIRKMGSIVAIVDGKIQTIWDVQIGEHYQIVADAMAETVRMFPIEEPFLQPQSLGAKVGIEKNYQAIPGSDPLLWEHFSVTVPKSYILKGEDIGPAMSDARGTKDSMLNGLNGISESAVETVLDLIGQNSLYRGEEQKFAVAEFRKLKAQFTKEAKTDQEKELFCWSRLKSAPASVTKMRGTAIGTLLTDLSEGMDLDRAVASFEAKVAPTNYKRPTALITKAMIEKAHQTIKELGYESALERRYATIEDITVNNILFADREAKKAMNVFETLAKETPAKPLNLDKIEEISIDKFISDVLPKAESLEIQFENRHASNLVSLIAPVHPDSKGMFKWGNNFSWSYTGEVTDSIRERVKRAGGSVTGDLRCSLSWFNYDDLDLHMIEPNGNEISYICKYSPKTGGQLDVDMNAGAGYTRTPVENITYPKFGHMAEGSYQLFVHQFNTRETKDVGFEAEMEFGGAIHHFVYDKVVKQSERIAVAEFEYSHKNGIKITKSLPSSQTSRKVWNVPTQTFHKVNVMMLSPNHWDGHGVGNRHYFFMMEGCVNEDKARGFFNEFLTEELNAHRKVFEVVGARMKTDESDRQLSGLGFSTTQRNHLLCRVGGSFNRVLKVTF